MLSFSRIRLLVLGLLIAVFGLGMAAAAQLTVNSDDLGAGVDEVLSCDSDGVNVSFSDLEYNSAFAGFVVMEVTISGIDPGCENQYIGVGLVNDPDQIGFIIPEQIAGPGDPDIEVVAAVYGPDPDDEEQLIQGVPAEEINRVGVLITESNFFS